MVVSCVCCRRNF
uniref:Uncharacterized protein n=1 Tax=Rhizophora mucronata TaxID=61149 RepID=A0A2P2PNR7_RHIMU